MTVAALLVGAALLGQTRTGDSSLTPTPRYVPKRTAPAATLDDERPTSAPPRSKFNADDEPADTGSRYNRTPLRDTRDEETPPSRLGKHATPPVDDLDNERLAPVGGAASKQRPPELISDALATVPEGALVGEPFRLVDALRTSRDRNQQIKLTQLYWRLAIAQADYHYCRDAVDRLREASRGQLNNPALRAARCAVRALQRDAEALVIRAQNDLFAQMGSAPGAPMPLATDRPHVGDYQTRFDQVYAGRTPPPRAYLIDRTLPVRRAQIDEHADGVVASTDALETTIEEYAKGTTDITTMMAAFERLWKERKAFTSAVREYNQDIAEYALAAAPSTSDEAALVAMLIKTKPTTPSGSAPRSTTPRLSEPVNDETPPARDRFDRGSNSTFRSSEPRDETEPEPPASTTTRNPFTARGTSFERGRVKFLLVQQQRQLMPGDPGFKRNIDFEDAASQNALWRGLVDVDTPLRTQRLATALNSEEALPKDSGTPTSLSECLRRSSPQVRRDVIAAYWRAREAAAVYQVYADEVNELAGLAQAATRIRTHKGGPEAVIRLQALRKEAKASLRDAQLDLLLAQFDLTSFCGTRLDGAWLLPSTAPHGGRYLLRLDEQPQRLIDERGLDRLGSLVKVLHEQMEDHAGTVVYADSARAMALKDPGAGAAAFDAAMGLVERQAAHTIFFLRATTKYNLAIADYVLAIMPDDTTPEKLASALVVTRSRT